MREEDMTWRKRHSHQGVEVDISASVGLEDVPTWFSTFNTVSVHLGCISQCGMRLSCLTGRWPANCSLFLVAPPVNQRFGAYIEKPDWRLSQSARADLRCTTEVFLTS